MPRTVKRAYGRLGGYTPIYNNMIPGPICLFKILEFKALQGQLKNLRQTKTVFKELQKMKK